MLAQIFRQADHAGSDSPEGATMQTQRSVRRTKHYRRYRSGCHISSASGELCKAFLQLRSLLLSISWARTSRPMPVSQMYTFL